MLPTSHAGASNHRRTAEQLCQGRTHRLCREGCSLHPYSGHAAHPRGRCRPPVRQDPGHMPRRRDAQRVARHLLLIDHAFDGPPWYPAIPWTEERISLVNTTIAPLLVRRYLAAYFFPRTQDGRPDRAAIDAALPNMEQHFSVLDRAVAKTSHRRHFTLADMNLPPILFLMVNEGYLTTTGEALIRSRALRRSHSPRPHALRNRRARAGEPRPACVDAAAQLQAATRGSTATARW